MPNIATVLKAEITRLAKKEAKAAVADTAKEIKELKTEVRDLRRQLASLNDGQVVAQSAPPPRRGRPPKNPGTKKPARGGRSVMSHTREIKALRKKLDVTQGELGGLLGLSNQSIYQYERKNGPLRLKAAVADRMEALRSETASSVRAQLGERKKPGRKPGRVGKQRSAKRGPGRPPKAASGTTAKRGPGRPPKAASGTTAKRGPGRPPKPASGTTAKRGPGRPPKPAAGTTAKRGPGRPPKAASGTTAKRGPGRPRKKRS